MTRHAARSSVVLTVNTGSSSVRLDLIEHDRGRFTKLEAHHQSVHAGDDRAVLAGFLRRQPRQPDVVVHRIVHGGPGLRTVARLDERTLRELRKSLPLAPLHLPAALRWVDACRRLLPAGTPQFVAPDSEFFVSLPQQASTYALPRKLAGKHGIRRFGFHGFAHQSMLRRFGEANPGTALPARVVTLQLGAGCSAAAIAQGRPVDTSMGFTPSEGLVMATRCGDIDAGLITYLQRRERWSAAKLSACLNEQSGLVGLAGSADMRVLLRRDNAADRCAVEIFVHRVRKYIGAYTAVLGGLDAILISGGIGEHSPELRARILEDFDWLGLRMDPRSNAGTVGKDGRVSARGSRVLVWVLAADEAGELARCAVDARPAGGTDNHAE